MVILLIVLVFVAALWLVLFLATRSERYNDEPPKFRLIQSTAPPPGERIWKWDVLTEREIEIVEKVIDGKRNSEIAQDLFLGTKTVGNYINRIYRKLDVHSRVQLIRAVRDHIR